ncbi:MAG: DUF4118 domain-containing protein [Thomasclavelia sp.]|uniref:DUF4118 domain-containing protein n=1 Tax=Thomasclavelia sp. TaxID=3025757 RepID=UPI0039A0679B
MDEKRPDPEELLKQIKHEETSKHRGKLKIFFGYAAGVGKTYAMLEAAHVAFNAGIDVVAGYVEPHQRPETLKLLDGLEILSPLKIKHNGILLNEFDLDGALKRNPDLILVDELAHTNDEQCRHLKRYQDINELLDHGIDVYTTINVQHIESLNDIIASITTVVVKERIPDYIFDKADQVELVDIEPEELINRLEAGKIYQKKQVQRALGNFFMLDNLVALREIALRRTADRVNKKFEQIKPKNKEHQYTNEHILICLSPAPSNQKVIRTASRMANAFFGEFTAVFVETPNFEKLPKKIKQSLRANIKLAVQLGANIVNLYGDDVPEQISEYAKFAGVSKIVLGRTNTKRKFSRNSFADRLIALTPSIDIYIIPDKIRNNYKPAPLKPHQFFSLSISDTIISIIIIIIVTLLGIWFRNLGFGEANIIMVHILGVLATSLLTENLIYTLLASLISVLSFNFFFTIPMHSFIAYDKGYPITFLIMFLTAFITGTLTKRVKEQARLSALKAYRTEILLKSSQKLQRAKTRKEIIDEISKQIFKLLDKTIIFYPIIDNELAKPLVYKSNPKEDEQIYLNKDEEAVATWVFKNNKHAGASTTTLPGAKCLYLAIRCEDDVLGVIGIYLDKSSIDDFENNLLMAILNEGAMALEKEASISKKREVEIKANQEELRANLLRSISHDLRTPLTSISGNAGVLLDSSDRLSNERKIEIYSDIYEDSMWLIDLVENLLSITRIENGNIQINKEVELINEIVLEAMHHISKDSASHIIQLDLSDDFIFVKIDARLIIQVIINIVNNAIKYTPKGSIIRVTTKKIDQSLLLEISDDGEGIPDNQKEKLFEMFYTCNNLKGDSRRGLGLGLALCKSIIEAHEGSIKIVDNYPKGSVFAISLPLEEVDIHG